MHAGRFSSLLLVALCVASTLQDDVARRTVNKCCPSHEHLYFSVASSRYECENLRQKTEREEDVADDGSPEVQPTPSPPESDVDVAGLDTFLAALSTSNNASLSENDVVAGVIPSCALGDTDWLFAPRDFQLRTTQSAVMLRTPRRHEFAAQAWCVDLDDEDDLVAVVCPCAGVGAVCVRKCCHQGEAFVEERSECVASSLAPWTPTPRDANVTYYLLNGKMPTICEHLTSERFHRGQLTLLSDGSMKGRDFAGRDNEFKPDKFCVDSTNSTNASNTDGDLLVVFCIDIDALSNAVTIFKGVITFVGALALLITVVLTAIFPEMRQNIHGKMALCHNVSLMGAFICIGVAQVSGNLMSEVSCKVLSFVMQYSLLAAFFWLNAMCIEISWAFITLRPVRMDVKGYTGGGKFIWYSVYAWGATTLISIITMVVEFSPGARLKPRFGEANCFFHGDDKIPQLLFLFGPMAVLLAFNLGLFIYTVAKITSLRRQTSQGSKINSRTNKNLVLYMKLFTVMGVTWVFEIVSWAVGGKNYYWLLLDCVNLLRGVFIFIIFCCKRSVLDLVRARFCCSVPRDGSQDSADSKLTAASQEGHELTSNLR